jgi:hypothetical protein
MMRKNYRSFLLLGLFIFSLYFSPPNLDIIQSLNLPNRNLCPSTNATNKSTPTGELGFPIVEDCLEAASISWDFIDKIIYINAKHATERNEAMIRDFLPVFQKKSKDVIRFEAASDTKMSHPLRVARSHIGALQLAFISGFKNVLILEDDVLWRVSPNRTNLLLLQDLVTRPYDVIILGGTAAIFSEDQRVVYAQTTSAYLVNGKFIPSVLGNFLEAAELLDQESGNELFAIDVWWHWLMEENVWYIITPALVIQTFHTVGYGYTVDGN